MNATDRSRASPSLRPTPTAMPRPLLSSRARGWNFTGGVRAWDIREPQAPVEVAFYVPESNANTEPAGYMTNNLEVDDRGYILSVDRNGAGLEILELHGKAKQIGLEDR